MRDITTLLDDKTTLGFFKYTRNGKLVNITPGIPLLFGYSRKEFPTIKFEDLLADSSMYLYLSLKFKQYGKLTSEKVLMRRKDNSNFWALVSLQYNEGTKSTYLIGYIEDISHAVDQENRMRHLENDYHRVKQQLDRFIYSASHDIRSPVSSILGLINIMKSDYKDEKSSRFVELLEVSVKRLDRFVYELASFAENEKREVKDSRIDFANLLDEVLERLDTHPAYQVVNIRKTVTVGTTFYSDFLRIKLILNHVIKNALDYYDTQKAKPTMLINIKSNDLNASIEILDNGIGISKIHLDKVFDLFYRASSFSKGSGMGLYLVREAVTKLNGVAEINSELGVGTSLRIVIPNSKKGIAANNKLQLKSKAAKHLA